MVYDVLNFYIPLVELRMVFLPDSFISFSCNLFNFTIEGKLLKAFFGGATWRHAILAHQFLIQGQTIIVLSTKGIIR